MKKSRVLLIYIMLSLVLFEGFFMDIGVPSYIKYVLDVLNIVLFIISFKEIKDNKEQFKYFALLYVIFFVLGSLSSIIHIGRWGFNIKYWVLDTRLYLRFPIFLISCSVILKKDDIEKIYDCMMYYQLVNTMLIIYQYFTVKADDYWMRGDYLNGFFGTSRGGNLYVNVLMVLVVIIVYLKWMNKKINKWFGIVVVATCLLDATLIELKYFYVELLIIVLLLLAFNYKNIKFTRENIIKGCAALLILMIVMFIMVQVLYKIYPWMKGTMSIKGIVRLATSQTGYSDSGDFNRLTAVTGVFNKCFNKNILDGLIGIGIGNCNTGGNMTAFAQLYDYTNYSWFQSSYVFSETGLIGLILYVLTFVCIYIKAGKDKYYSQIVKVIVVLSLLLLIYDEVLKTEGAYLIFFLLAAGFINEKRDELV